MAGAANPQQTQPSVYNTSAGAYNTAVNNAASPAAFGQQTAAYMNPFTQQVTNRTMMDMERQRQMQMNNIGAAATAANAFGGSRHGIAEAETNRGFADAFANQAANLNYQGYNNAQNVAMGQNQMLSNLASQGFGFGEAITDRQQQQGLLQQGLSQALIDAAQGQWQGYANAPGQSLSYPLAAIGGVPQPQSQTTSKKPGLFDYLTLALSV